MFSALLCAGRSLSAAAGREGAALWGSAGLGRGEQFYIMRLFIFFTFEAASCACVKSQSSVQKIHVARG